MTDSWSDWSSELKGSGPVSLSSTGRQVNQGFSSGSTDEPGGTQKLGNGGLTTLYGGIGRVVI